MKISAVINIYDEAHLLVDCLESLKGFADEIIVSDMGSSDGGPEIAKRYGCQVFTVPHRDIVEHTIIPRITRASGEWIVLFDPDMRLPPHTAERLRQVVQNDEADVVQFALINRVFGSDVRYGHGSSTGFIKFFKRKLFLDSPVKVPRIHSMISDVLLATSARWLRLGRNYPLHHIAYDTVHSCFQQHLRYARYEADERWNRGIRFSWMKMFWEPTKKMLIDFGVWQAWRGGMPAIIYSFISELMLLQIHLLLWEKDRNNGDVDRKQGLK